MPMRLLASTLLAAVMVIGPATAANAACYADDKVIQLDLSGDILYGGDTLGVTATHPSGFEGDWTLTLAITGETATATATSTIAHDFTTPVVPERTLTKITATFAFDDGQCLASSTLGSGAVPAIQASYSPGTQAALPAAIDTVTAEAQVTLLPRDGGDGGGLLPNTGGSRLALLLAGMIAVLGGGYGAYRFRRA